MGGDKNIQTDKAPAAIGAYSQAFLAGDTLYVSGQLGIEPGSGQIVEGGISAQTKQALANIKAILLAAGFCVGDVVSMQVFLAEINDFAEMNEVYGAFFEEPYPARAVVAVSGLPKGAAVEIMATAVKNV